VLAQHTQLALKQADHIASLHAAMRSRQTIGEATGILVERHRVDAHAAFSLLVQASQRLNVKLRVIAEHVALTGQDPASITIGDLPDPAARDPFGTPHSTLQISVSVQDERTVLQVGGQIDLATRPQLEKALSAAGPAPGTSLIVDLTGVQFCDAGGLRTLLSAARDGLERTAPLRVVPSTAVLTTIGLADMPETLELYPDLRHALAGRRG
jgi:anti-anti-sigma factor